MNVYPIRLSPHVLEVIEQEWFDTVCDYFDQPMVEFAGWLWSRQGADWSVDGIEIVEAAGAGIGAEKSCGEVKFSVDYLTGYLLDLDLLFRAERLELCGGFHSHPQGSDQPSDGDMDPDTGRIAAVLNLRTIWECTSPLAVELIYTPRRDPPAFRPARAQPRFKRWQATPWVLRRGTGGSLDRDGIWPSGGAYLEKGDAEDVPHRRF